jgi:hypothetical protein
MAFRKFLVSLERRAITVSERGLKRSGGSQTLSRPAFFDEIIKVLRRDLSGPLADFRTRRFGHLLKVFYGNERVHFEVWADGGRDQIELGLHFEDGPESTQEYLAFFDRRIVEIKGVAGESLELERWTASWGHLFEILPLQPLTRERARATGERLALLIEKLQPLVDEAGVEASGMASYRRGRYFRRRR